MIAEPNFFGNRAAADEFAGFENQHTQAGFAEIGGGDQSVVTGTNDNGVETI